MVVSQIDLLFSWQQKYSCTYASAILRQHHDEPDEDWQHPSAIDEGYGGGRHYHESTTTTPPPASDDHHGGRHHDGDGYGGQGTNPTGKAGK